jgi:glucokinase
MLLHNTWQRSMVPATGTVHEIIDAWCRVITGCYVQHHLKPVGWGIAMPGPFNYEEGISYIRGQNKYESLYGLNVKMLLAEKLGIKKETIHFTNDAACFLQGELVTGAAKSTNGVIGITLGTGLGSATCKNGKVQDAGWWRVPFKEGIAEDYLSTRWFTKRYRELSGNAIDNVRQLLDIGDRVLLQNIFNEFGYNLGDFLLQAISQDQIQLVVLGGNITQAFPLFEFTLLQCLSQAGNNTPVKPAVLGEQAALIGAAAAAMEELEVDSDK